MSTGLRQLVADLPADHERVEIPGGYRGTAATIDRMRDLVTLGKREKEIVALTGALIRDCKHKDYLDYARRCFEFCQREIKYAFDPSNVEMLESPLVTLQTRRADCDCISVLLASMFESLGFPARFKTIRADSSRPDDFSHVFVEVKIPRHGWVPADATMQHPFGWEPGPEYSYKVWPASKDGAESHDTDEMAGLGTMKPIDWERRNLIARQHNVQYQRAPMSASFRTIEEGFRTDKQAWPRYQSATPDLFIPKAHAQISGLRGFGEMDGWSDTWLPYIQAALDGKLEEQLNASRSAQTSRAVELERAAKQWAGVNSAKAVGARAAAAKAITLNQKAMNATDAALEAYRSVRKVMQDHSIGFKLSELSADQMMRQGGATLMIAGATMVTKVQAAVAAEQQALEAKNKVPASSGGALSVGVLATIGIAGGLAYLLWKRRAR